MNGYWDAAAAAQWKLQISDCRAVLALEANSPSARLEACSRLIEAYCALGLTERAVDWIRAGELLADGSADFDLLARFGLASLEVWLDREDREAAIATLERLKAWPEPDAESERRLLAAQVRIALLSDPPEPFAALEKAFRNLRGQPSSLWASRLHLWKARWLADQGRDPEALISLKRALGEAELAQDVGAELDVLLSMAEFRATPRAKALRAARQAYETAERREITRARERAQGILSRLAAGRRESESASACLALFRSIELSHREAGRLDREAQEADTRVLDRIRQDRRRFEVSTLATIAARLAAHQGLAECFDGLYTPLRSLLVADVFGIALWTPEQQALDYSLFIEDGRRTRVGLISVNSTRSLGAWCFRERRPVRVNDIEREYTSYLEELSKLSEHRPKSMLFQPLLAGDETLGIVTVQSFAKGSYTVEAEALFAVVASCLSLRLQRGSRSG